jgi:hypothetical protein
MATLLDVTMPLDIRVKKGIAMKTLVHRLRYAGLSLGIVCIGAGGACIRGAEGSDAPVETSGESAVDCSTIANACHDVEHGDGPSHACHELGHAGDEAACAAGGAECIELCSAAHEPGTDDEESGEHDHEEPESP